MEEPHNLKAWLEERIVEVVVEGELVEVEEHRGKGELHKERAAWEERT